MKKLYWTLISANFKGSVQIQPHKTFLTESHLETPIQWHLGNLHLQGLLILSLAVYHKMTQLGLRQSLGVFGLLVRSPTSLVSFLRKKKSSLPVRRTVCECFAQIP